MYRYPDLKDDVDIQKVKDHFIFTVESVGAVEPEELVWFIEMVNIEWDNLNSQRIKAFIL